MTSALVIKHGDVYSPLPKGKTDISCLNKKIISMGKIHKKSLEDLRLDYEIIDARNCWVFPGFIDPQELILGGSGESDFCSRPPELGVHEIIRAGITTAVCCLGADTVTRNMHSLIAHARMLNNEGITTYVYTGGYTLPPTTLTGHLNTDIILIPEIIGVGELAISDYRSSQPTVLELAKVISNAFVAGTLSGKAGVTRIHLGDGKKMMDPLVDLLRDYDIKPESLYPTHVNRHKRLLEQAALMSKEIAVDMDVYDQDLIVSLKTFLNEKGNLGNLTLSTDAGTVSPYNLYSEMKKVIREMKWSWQKLLPLVTTNPARILKLKHKGQIAAGYDADMIIVEKKTLEIKHVISDGRWLLKNFKLQTNIKSMKTSNRIIEIYGEKK